MAQFTYNPCETFYSQLGRFYFSLRFQVPEDAWSLADRAITWAWDYTHLVDGRGFLDACKGCNRDRPGCRYSRVY